VETADFQEMLVKALLCWLVVIRGDLQRGIRAGFFSLGCQIYRFAGRIPSGTRHHMDFFPGRIRPRAHDLDMFLVIQRGRFARRSDRHDAIDAGGDLPSDQPFKSGRVKLSVTKRGDERGVSSTQHAAIKSTSRREFKNQFDQRFRFSLAATLAAHSVGTRRETATMILFFHPATTAGLPFIIAA